MDRICTACDTKKPFSNFCYGPRVSQWCRDCRNVLVRRKTRRFVDRADADIFRQRHNIIAEQKAVQKKLNPDTVRLIRTMYSKGRPVITIARGLNIERTTVSKIVNNKSYREVK